MQNSLRKNAEIMCWAQRRSSANGSHALCGHSQCRLSPQTENKVDESLKLANSLPASESCRSLKKKKKKSQNVRKDNSEHSDVFNTWKGRTIFFPNYTFCFINLSKVRRGCRYRLEHNREVNVLMRQNDGKLFPGVDFVTRVTGWGMEIQAGVDV